MALEDLVLLAVDAGELEIDRQGRIWRLAARRADRWNGGTRSFRCHRRRAERTVGKGYLQVRVMIDGIRAEVFAHRVVWISANGPIPDGLTINHKDGVRANNQLDNLELATMKEQVAHAISVLGWSPKAAALAYHARLTPAQKRSRGRNISSAKKKAFAKKRTRCTTVV